MKKILLLMMTFVTLANVNAQDITTGLVFHLTGNEDISATITSSDASAATGIVKFSDTEEVEGDASNASITHSQGVDGTANGAFNIGTGSYIEFQAADINGLPVGGVGTSNGVENPNGTDRTYAAWIKGNSLEGNIFSYGTPVGGQHVHMHLEEDGTRVKMGHWSHDWKFNNLSYSDGNWHHIVLKIYESSAGNDAPEIELFVDGVSVETLTQTDGTTNVMNTNISIDGYKALTVGMRNTIEKDFVGEMDDLRIYNRALTSADIEALFANKGTNVKEETPNNDVTDGLVFHLTGNEDISATITSSDASVATGVVKFSDTEEVEGDASNASITHSQGVDGTANGAFNIGTGSYIEFQAADINGLPVGGVGTSNGVENPNGTDRTYAAWIKGNSLEGNIFSYGTPVGGQHVHMHLEEDGTRVKMGHWSHDWKFNNLSYSDGNWHHIALKIYESSAGNDAPEIELFVDGVSVETLTQTDGTTNVMNTNISIDGYKALTVGMRNTIEKDFVGEIDDLRIYNRALTTEEVETLFANKGAVSLSVNTVDQKTDFNVYLSDSNTLKVESNLEIDKLSIISLTGAVLKEMKTNESVDISELASGLYIIVGESKNGRSTAKFIKQ